MSGWSLNHHSQSVYGSRPLWVLSAEYLAVHRAGEHCSHETSVLWVEVSHMGKPVSPRGAQGHLVGVLKRTSHVVAQSSVVELRHDALFKFRHQGCTRLALPEFAKPGVVQPATPASGGSWQRGNVSLGSREHQKTRNSSYR